MSEVRAIFVTGGASGIGLATGRLFAARGWRVGLADLDPQVIDAAAALPGVHHGYVMDVRDRDAWAVILDAFARESGGRLDVLFNNAGVCAGGAFAAADFAAIDRMVAINLTGVLDGARIGHAHLAATPGSCLLNTASAASLYGSPGLAIYSATKFAVRGLTEALDAEWHVDGIRVRALIPGFVDTPLLDRTGEGSTRSLRRTVIGARLEITPAATVAEAAWRAVHGDAVHVHVGRTARRLHLAARWLPRIVRARMRRWSGGG